MTNKYIFLRRTNEIIANTKDDGQDLDDVTWNILKRQNGQLQLFKTELIEASISEKEFNETIERDDSILAEVPEFSVRLPSGNDFSYRVMKSLNDDRSFKASESDLSWSLDAIGASKTSYDGAGVRVGILDSGIVHNHSAFPGGEFNFQVENYTNECAEDVHGHGTHCAGIFFGHDINGKRIGVARGVRDVFIGKLFKEEKSTFSKVIQGFLESNSFGAQVISSSFVVDLPTALRKNFIRYNDIELARTKTLLDYQKFEKLMKAIAIVFSDLSHFGMGSIIIAPSGNDSFHPLRRVTASPHSSYQNILSIGAIREGLRAQEYDIWEGSNVDVDLVAPGYEIDSAYVGGGLYKLSGTSMAVPHVAGVAALWAQKMQEDEPNKFLSIEDLMSNLVSTAKMQRLSSSSATTENVGSGVVQCP